MLLPADNKRRLVISNFLSICIYSICKLHLEKNLTNVFFCWENIHFRWNQKKKKTASSFKTLIRNPHTRLKSIFTLSCQSRFGQSSCLPFHWLHPSPLALSLPGHLGLLEVSRFGAQHGNSPAKAHSSQGSFARLKFLPTGGPGSRWGRRREPLGQSPLYWVI